MDYLAMPRSFQARKVLRYIKLYGPRRTLVKVRAQQHFSRTYEILPSNVSGPKSTGRTVGVIGCGNFSYSNVGYYLRKNYGNVIRGVMDTDVNRAASFFEQYRSSYYTTDANQLLSDPQIDLIYIASNHASHADYAALALRAGKAVHVEKPHAVTEEQLRRLVDAMLATDAPLNLGFNRPDSRLGQAAYDAMKAEEGPAMYNWFVAGHEIPPDHWYFAPEEGGRVLGNLCHWIDFVYRFVASEGRYPIRIVPTRWHKSDCDISVSYVFGDGTTATITFSAKGHTFEGVRERFSAHRGRSIVVLDDFAQLVTDRGHVRTKIRERHRDHGHERNIKRSYEMAHGNPGLGRSAAYVWETGHLALETKRALELNQPLEVRSFGDTYNAPSTLETSA